MKITYRGLSEEVAILSQLYKLLQTDPLPLAKSAGPLQPLVVAELPLVHAHDDQFHSHEEEGHGEGKQGHLPYKVLILGMPDDPYDFAEEAHGGQQGQRVVPERRRDQHDHEAAPVGVVPHWVE
jgi:hypothetical protein